MITLACEVSLKAAWYVSLKDTQTLQEEVILVYGDKKKSGLWFSK